MTWPPASAAPEARLEAAALSIRMIAALAPDSGPYVPVLAHRFAVDEEALRDAVWSRAIDRAYNRIHSNGAAAGPGLVESAW